MRRFRRVLAPAFLVIGALSLGLGLLAGWANTTVYDSATFSERSVDLLNSPAIRRAMATRLTEQLARNGNQQAVSFRPAFELAVDAAIDTDTFRSIFRTAVRRTHEAVLVDPDRSGGGLDLSDSITIITATVQLPQNAQPTATGERSLDSSLTDVVDRLGGLGLWRFDEISAGVFAAGSLLGLAALVASVVLAEDRRRAVRRVGVAVVVVGLALAGLVSLAGLLAGQAVADPVLRDAVEAGVARLLADLFSLGLWTAGYGLVVVAAAGAMDPASERVTPASTVRAVGRWVEVRRATSGGTLLLGGATVLAGLVLVSAPAFWSRVAVVGLGLWLVYFGIAEVLRLVRSARVVPVAPGRARAWRYAGVAGLALVMVAAVTAAGVFSVRRAATTAAAAGEKRCNGEASRCDLPLDAAVFPGSHNSMSSPLYPGFLFGEQINTIAGQLDHGVRALLIDTHYGVPSQSRLPGTDVPIVLTDRAASLAQPVGEEIDPVVVARAEQLAARAPRAADAQRDLYLCHNYCELGAIRFSDALADIADFLDTHPDDVVIAVIQDATTPADTAAAIEAAGLAERVWTLDPEAPLPTLGEMIDQGRTLLVFAEEGGPGAPPWYHQAYEWFQETRYRFTDPADMGCEPNRGSPDNPLFLVNHWVGRSPPDPSVAARANSRAVLEERLVRCAAERGRVPNVVAVDFAERGDLLAVTAELEAELVEQFARIRAQAGGSSAPGRDADGRPIPALDPAEATGGLLPEPTPYTSLTGGDPTTFCSVGPPTARLVAAWALASWSEPPSQIGLADLAYGPLAERTLAATIDAAPLEVATRITPAQQHAAAAVAALRAAGVDQAAIDAAATQAAEEVLGADPPDPVVLVDLLLATLADGGDTTGLTGVAAAFRAATPAPADLFDLGTIPPDLARSSGYGCVVGD